MKPYSGAKRFFKVMPISSFALSVNSLNYPDSPLSWIPASVPSAHGQSERRKEDES